VHNETTRVLRYSADRSVTLLNTHNRFTTLCTLSGTTRVCKSRYRKKHSPTHTYRPYLLSPSFTIHGNLPVQFTCLTVFFHNLSPSFLWSTSWPGTLHFILHTFLHPIIVFFSQHMPIVPIASVKYPNTASTMYFVIII